ncbi:MAG: transposase [Clostridia bacterium]|nr:transposase [Clostridia bacterium]
MQLPKRKRIRLKDYDYSKDGYYFITVCTQNRKNILSTVGEGFPLPKLTQCGEITERLLLEITERYEEINIDKYVIMPNHIHLVIALKNDGRGNPSPTIDRAMGWFKYMATKEINKLLETPGKKIFQRSFHDHIIRGEDDYKEIWQYIDSNPSKWKEDIFYTE